MEDCISQTFFYKLAFYLGIFRCLPLTTAVAPSLIMPRGFRYKDKYHNPSLGIKTYAVFLYDFIESLDIVMSISLRQYFIYVSHEKTGG